jgi:deoxycytidine triphosphate deaminase
MTSTLSELSSGHVLAGNELRERVFQSSLANRLIVSPLLEASQVGTSSVDLRLGFSFIIPKRANVACIEPAEIEHAMNVIEAAGRKIGLLDGRV